MKRVRDKVDKENTSIEYYVGGEHFDVGEIRITKKGMIQGSTIGPAFHMRFTPGDVLLMSRNPHLRKAGVVDFEGICSDVSYVLRTKDEEKMLQDYLIYVLHTDSFWNFAEANKKGSTNFFLNWTDFERYEFNLPSLEVQKKLTALLSAVTKTRYLYKDLLNKIDELIKARFIEFFGDPIENSEGWKTEKLENVAPIVAAELPEEDIYWWLNLDMIQSNTGNLIDKIWTPKEDIGKSTTTFNDSMVLYSKLRPYLNKVLVPDGYGYATTELVTLNPNPNILNKYFLSNLLRGDEFVRYANDLSSGAQMPRMPMKKLRSFPCILPPIELQNEFVKFAKKSEHVKVDIIQSIEETNELIKALMEENQITK